jgi:hypothetical protein
MLRFDMTAKLFVTAATRKKLRPAPKNINIICSENGPLFFFN